MKYLTKGMRVKRGEREKTKMRKGRKGRKGGIMYVGKGDEMGRREGYGKGREVRGGKGRCKAWVNL